MFLKELVLTLQCPRPAIGPVGRKSMHSLWNPLYGHADACFCQAHSKGLCIFPQAVFSG